MTDLHITSVREGELDAVTAEAIRALQAAAFPEAGFFAHQRWSGTPLADDDLWLLAWRDGVLVGSTRVVHRTVSAPKRDVHVAGIGNVCSSPDARGSGVGKACMRAAQQYIAGGAVEFGLLFCRDRVHNFYARLGWLDVANAVRIRDDGGERLLQDRHTMIYPGRCPASDWPAGELRLNGPRW